MENLNQEAKGGCFNHGKPALAIGDGAKTGPALVTTFTYCIDGIAYSKTGAATVRPLTVDTVQPILTKCLYLICIDAAGTSIISVKGVAVLTADLVAGTKVLQWPALPANYAPVGAVKITLANAATFTPGTTALDATDVSATYYDLFSVPTAPLTS